MTVQKLSQITASPSNLAPTDYLVGVTAGNVDYRFSPAQVGASSAIDINTTPITGGTLGAVLYDNAGTVGGDSGFTYSSGIVNAGASAGGLQYPLFVNGGTGGGGAGDLAGIVMTNTSLSSFKNQLSFRNNLNLDQWTLANDIAGVQNDDFSIFDIANGAAIFLNGGTTRQISVPANWTFGFSPNNAVFSPATAAADTALSRISSGVIGVGNGTIGDVSGAVVAGYLVANGTATWPIRITGANTSDSVSLTIDAAQTYNQMMYVSTHKWYTGLGSGAETLFTVANSFYIFDVANSVMRFVINANGSVFLNASNLALATNATDGFTYIATCAGTPTGTPTARTGTVPMVFDTTNSQFWFYTGGAWKQPKTPGGAATVTWQ